MATSSSFSRNHFHVRSASLPSGPHPLAPKFEKILCSLRSSIASTSSAFRSQFNGLLDLHGCVNNLLLLPEAQQALAKECHERSVDEILDGSLKLLDVCEAAKDVLLEMKLSAQDFQSSLRRKGTELSKEASKYLASRKNVRKSIHKALRDLKGHQATSEEHEALSMMREAELATASVLESLLSFISGREQRSSWSLVSKLMQTKQICVEDANEFEKIDAAIQSVYRKKNAGIDDLQIHLGDLVSSIKDIEEGTESLNRHLIKTRVTLLNIRSL